MKKGNVTGPDYSFKAEMQPLFAKPRGSSLTPQSNFALKSAKKMIFPNAIENSEDFKNLGTFHRERRQMDYVPADPVG